jgi:predicted metalloprotease with PDZ domain
MELRAGLLDERGYLKHLSEELTELEVRPARLSQSVEQSSIDAWLEKYPYYNSPARSISYYNKGELLGVLLDLQMRQATNDRVSLRDLFQWLNLNYAKKGKFFNDSDGIREGAEALSHADLRDFFQQYVSGVEEIPWDSFFRRVGLRVSVSQLSFADPGFVATRAFDQPLVVVEVESGSSADRAGLHVGDVIKEINGKRGTRDLQTMIAKLAAGSELHLVVERGPIERELHWTLGSRKQNILRLEDLPEITREQKSHREAWLFDRGTQQLPH